MRSPYVVERKSPVALEALTATATGAWSETNPVVPGAAANPTAIGWYADAPSGR